MKVFIFGAGASHGSLDTNVSGESSLPPLTNQLFDPAYATSASKVGLAPHKLEEFKSEVAEEDGDLEQWLTNKWEHAKELGEGGHGHRHLRDVGKIAFYIWHLLKHVSSCYHDDNHYSTLVNTLNKDEENFAFITFNYDTLLDIAVQKQSSIQFTSLEDYRKQNYYKLHGSVNWFLQKRNEDRDISNATGISTPVERFKFFACEFFLRSDSLNIDPLITVEPEAVVLSQDDHLSAQMTQDRTYFPLMFLPTTSKMYDLVRGFEVELLKPAQEALREATEVFIIGYQARDQIARDLFSHIRPDTVVRVVSTTMGKSRGLAKRLTKESLTSVKDVDGFEGNFQDFVRQYPNPF